ncbi:MAG: O-antigen ligase family protein [Pseudomonadota bacterium]
MGHAVAGMDANMVRGVMPAAASVYRAPTGFVTRRLQAVANACTRVLAGHTSLVHNFSLAAVWLTMVAGAVVFAEPAPVDVLMAGLIILLPVVGLAPFKSGILIYAALWLLVCAGSYIASGMASTLTKPVMHTTITLFLVLGMVVIAAFAAHRPVRHVKLILHAQLVAACVAACAGLVGYFSLVPGGYELFTKFGRAAGTFKDPNVFGPFIAFAAVYALRLTLDSRGRKALAPLALLLLLTGALLLSFSRGAWINFAVAALILVYLTFVTTREPRARGRLLRLIAMVAAAGTLALVIAVQFEQVAGLLSERATLSQSYDSGPEGRFGGQAKAVDLILRHPLGLGAAEFQKWFHHEDVHNVYLVMFLNGGWIGGLAYLLAVALPLVLGLGVALQRGPAQPLVIVVYAAFCGTALEGVIIDTDHWRHFYLQAGLLVGLMCAPRAGGKDQLDGQDGQDAAAVAAWRSPATAPAASAPMPASQSALQRVPQPGAKGGPAPPSAPTIAWDDETPTRQARSLRATPRPRTASTAGTPVPAVSTPAPASTLTRKPPKATTHEVWVTSGWTRRP